MWNQYSSTTVFVTPFYVFNILIGTAANLFVISSYWSNKNKKKQPFNYLIANFSIANLLQTAIFNPILLAYRGNPDANIIANTSVCTASLFSCMLAITMSFALFPLMAYERHESIKGLEIPMSTIKNSVLYLWLACGIVAVGYTIMVLFDTIDAPLGIKRDRCIIASQGIDYVTISFIIYSMVVYGIAILISLAYMKQPVAEISKSHPDEAERTKKVNYVMLATILLWIPFIVIQFIGIFGTYSETTFNYHGYTSAIGLLAPVVSPLIIMKGGITAEEVQEKEKCKYSVGL